MKIKRFNELIIESNSTECDTFKINAVFNIDFYDGEYKYIITEALGKMYIGLHYGEVAIPYIELKNSEIVLEVSSYSFLGKNEVSYVFNVYYNKNRYDYTQDEEDEDADGMDDQDTVLKGIENAFDHLTYYRYRTIYDMGTVKKTNIEFLKMVVVK